MAFGPGSWFRPAPHRPRARLNSVFIATFFLGGALGSQLGSLTYHSGGWTAVTALGAALPLLALLYWLTERRKAARNAAPDAA